MVRWFCEKINAFFFNQKQMRWLCRKLETAQGCHYGQICLFEVCSRSCFSERKLFQRFWDYDGKWLTCHLKQPGNFTSRELRELGICQSCLSSFTHGIQVFPNHCDILQLFFKPQTHSQASLSWEHKNPIALKSLLPLLMKENWSCTSDYIH